MGEPLPVALSKCLTALNNGDANLRTCEELYPEYHAALPKLLNIAVELTYLPYVSPAEQFRKESRSRILKHISQKRAGKGPRSVPNFGAFLKAPVLAVMLVVFAVMIFGGRQVAHAATASLPGDSLYGVKTLVEDTQLMLGDDAEDVALHLAFAQTRLDEVSQLTDLQRFDDIPTAVTGFEQHTRLVFQSLVVLQQDDPVFGEQMAAVVEEKTTENLEVLTNLAATAPGQVQTSLQQAMTLTVELNGTTPAADVPVSMEPAPAVNANVPASNPGGQVENAQNPVATGTSTPVANPGNSGNAGNSGNGTPGSTANGNSNNNGNDNSGANGNANSDNNGNAGNSGNSGGNNGDNSGGNSGSNNGNSGGNNGNDGNNGNGKDK